MAQVAHAAFEYARTHTQTTREWLEYSSYLVVLSCADEKELEQISDAAMDVELMVSDFFEPDLYNALTATAIQHRRPWSTPDAVGKILSHLPLASREEVK